MSSLSEVWEGAAGNPFHPAVAKSSQFLVGFSLLTIGWFHDTQILLRRSSILTVEQHFYLLDSLD